MKKQQSRVLEIISNSDYEKGDTCVVTISDCHFYNDSAYGKYNGIGVNSDLEDKFKIFCEAVDVAAYLGAPLVNGGDFIDKRNPDGITLNFVAQAVAYIKHAGLPDWIFIGGNHEADDKHVLFSTIKQYRYLVGTLDNRKRGHIFTDPAEITIRANKQNIHFICLPANRRIETQLKDYLGSIKRIKSKLVCDYLILVLHGGIQGADLGSMRAPEGIKANLIEECSRVFDWVVCGDFHKFQFVNDLSNVYYCGAPKQMNTGEIGHKRGYQILNLTKGTLNFVKSNSPTFKVLEWVPGEYQSPILKNPNKYQSKIKNRILVVKITGTVDQINEIDFSSLKKKLIDVGAYGVYKDPNPVREQRNSVQINKDLPIQEIISQYVEHRDYDLDEKVKQRHIKILNQYAKGSHG